MNREQMTQEAVTAAWTQFQRMPNSNPGDYAHAIVRALIRAREAIPCGIDEFGKAFHGTVCDCYGPSGVSGV